tara:strand:+ start:1032 stop:1244 length:213 start_codon:yes stop_codon:yes gene_type:complete
MWSYLLFGISVISFGLYGFVKLNLKTLQIEIETLKEELKKKDNLTDAEKEWLSIADKYLWEQQHKVCKVK